MVSMPVLTAKLTCPNCGHAGMLWNTSNHLPRVSNGFHFESGREGPHALPLIVCDYCDEIMELRPNG